MKIKKRNIPIARNKNKKKLLLKTKNKFLKNIRKRKEDCVNYFSDNWKKHEQRIKKRLKKERKALKVKFQQIDRWFLEYLLWYSLAKYYFEYFFSPRDFLRGITKGKNKFPRVTRNKNNWIPHSKFGISLLIILIVLFLKVDDLSLKRFLFRYFKLNFDGFGSLANLGTSTWAVLATVVSVGLATVGIIIQTIGQGRSGHTRKMLLNHYFVENDLDNKIRYSFITLLLSGTLLFFKEKVFYFSVFSQHIYFVFLISGIFIFIYSRLIIDSFDYIFPKRQDEFVNDYQRVWLRKRIDQSAQSLILIDVLKRKLEPLGVGVEYFYNEEDLAKNTNVEIIKTRQMGSVIDINLKLLKKASELISRQISNSNKKMYLEEEDEKLPIKIKIIIEYGRVAKQKYKPLAIVHKDVTSRTKLMIKKAIILTHTPPPPIDDEMEGFQEWIWEGVRSAAESGSQVVIKDRFRDMYEFLDDVFDTYKSYKKKYEIQEGSSIDKWEFLQDVRQRYYSTLEYCYKKALSAQPLFSLNYFPFGAMQRAINTDSYAQFKSFGDLLVQIYTIIFRSEIPNKKGVRYNFFLTNKNFADFYILSGGKENFLSKKSYFDLYRYFQTNFVRKALDFGDTQTIEDIDETMTGLIRHISYWDRYPGTRQVDRFERKLGEIIKYEWWENWLDLQSWTIERRIEQKLEEEVSRFILQRKPWLNLSELTELLSMSLKADLSSRMQWDSWEFEERPFWDTGGSFGNFETIILRGFAVQALDLIKRVEGNVSKIQRYIDIDNSYLKLVLSDENRIPRIITEISEKYEEFQEFFSNINSSEELEETASRLQEYLGLVVADMETSRQDAVIAAEIDNGKIVQFKNKFLEGYESNTIIRKLLKEQNSVELLLNEGREQYFGIHQLIDKEPFTNVSSISYGGMATHHGQRLAAIEDHLILKKIFELEGANSLEKYNAKNIISALDEFLDSLPADSSEEYAIFLMGGFNVNETIVTSNNFVWSHTEENVKGRYKNFKVYSRGLGDEKGLIVMSLSESIKVRNFTPDINGEMIGPDSHISFVIEELDEEAVISIMGSDQSDEKKKKLERRLRLRGVFSVEIDLVDQDSIFRIEVQSEESSS